jgi:phosphoribosylcarboxyaminoimidazole (NCAIR) mutase
MDKCLIDICAEIAREDSAYTRHYCSVIHEVTCKYEQVRTMYHHNTPKELTDFYNQHTDYAIEILITYFQGELYVS